MQLAWPLLVSRWEKNLPHMNPRLILLFVMLWPTGLHKLRAQGPTDRVAASNMYPLSRLPEAQQAALAQGKPVGFLLTWPIFFPGAANFHNSGSQDSTTFYRAFKDQAVLVNVDHATGEVDRVPKVARDAFHSPAEGGFAPCLCLTNPTFTRLIGIIPLWKHNADRDDSFNRFQALIADRASWWDGPAPVASTAPAAPTGPVSAGFAREMELTRQAELQTRKASPSPRP